MDMATDDWKAVRNERARVELVERMDAARRVTALESALKYEAEAADRMRTQMMAAIECAAIERAEHADTLAHRDSVIAQQAATVGTLRAELAAAIDAQLPGEKESAYTVRAEVDLDGDTFTCDFFWDAQHQIVESIDSVWIGSMNVGPYLSDETMDGLAAALERWHEDAVEGAKREPVEA